MLAVAAVGWVWRLNLVMNHPEKEERLREWERKRKEERNETIGKMCKPLAPVAGDLLRKVLTKK
jgi:hypothetical protein